MGNWIRPNRQLPGKRETWLCKLGLHSPAEWRRNVEPDFHAEVTLVVERRWCGRCGAMQYRELKRCA